jgi:NADH-quinone oxidoreductase subunit J
VSGAEIVFVVLGIAGLAAAFRMVTTSNVVHGALYLVLALSAVAGTFLLLGAEFVAWVQVLIYVGAIVVLLLFALMLTKAPIGRETLDNRQRGLAAVVALVVFAGLAWLLADGFSGATIAVPPHPSSAAVGEAIFTDFVLPFEVVSVLLLAALIGAVVLARKDEK